MQKLELTWIGKGEQISPEPRILIEKPEHAYGYGVLYKVNSQHFFDRNRSNSY